MYPRKKSSFDDSVEPEIRLDFENDNYDGETTEFQTGDASEFQSEFQSQGRQSDRVSDFQSEYQSERSSRAESRDTVGTVGTVGTSGTGGLAFKMEAEMTELGRTTSTNPIHDDQL